MSFSFCLNKPDTLILCGMALLYQTLDLKQDSKVLKDNEKLVNAVIKLVDRAKAPGSYDFKRVAGLLIAVEEPSPPQSLPTPPRQSPDTCMAAPPARRTSPPTTMSGTAHRMHPALGLHAGASASETDLLRQQEKLRRMTMPQPPQLAPPPPPPPPPPQQQQQQQQNAVDQYRARSRQSFDGLLRHDVPIGRRDHRLSLSQAQAAQAAMIARVSPGGGLSTAAKPNLDYLSLSTTPQSQPSSPVQGRGQHVSSQLCSQLQKASSTSTAEWEALLGSMDGGPLSVYDTMYGGGGPGLLTETPVSTASWSPNSWDLGGFNLGDFGPASATTHSVLSLSEDGLSSGDDVAPSEMGLGVAGLDCRNALLPVTTACGTTDGYVLGGMENFGLYRLNAGRQAD